MNITLGMWDWLVVASVSAMGTGIAYLPKPEQKAFVLMLPIPLVRQIPRVMVLATAMMTVCRLTQERWGLPAALAAGWGVILLGLLCYRRTAQAATRVPTRQSLRARP